MEQPALGEITGTILVADGNTESRNYAVKHLSQSGFEVESAVNGQEALYKFVLSRPDLVLVDEALPGLDGFRVCEAIRRDPHGHDVPIILVLREQDGRAIARGFRVGATDFITRPVNWLLLSLRKKYILRAHTALRQLKKSEAGLDFAQRLARMGSWTWDPRKRELQWSDQLARLLHLDGEPSFDRLLSVVHDDDKAELAHLFQIAFQSGDGFSIDHRIDLGGERDEMHVHQEVEVILDSGGAPVQIRGVVQDITHRIRADRKIRYLAYYNSLTGLPNRQFFSDHLARYLELAQVEQTNGAVLFIDIDSLKRVNDTFGHQFGDLLINAVAKRLEALTAGFRLATNPDEQTTVLAHSGGGLFLMMVYPYPGEGGLIRLAQRIISELSKPYRLEERELFITASIGCISFPEHGREVGVIIRNGERAMFHAKREGRNTYQIYTPELRGGSPEILSLESDLRRAVERGQLVVHYQPKLHIPTGRIRGVEALLRWQHPEKGMVSPARFIPLAEENGLILSIGAWVLDRACHEIRRLHDAGLPSSVAVNLSGRQFLRQLKDRGIRVSVDDFGTGYSSLSYLKRFPIDVLKIDGAFVRNIEDDQDNQAITSAILAMCHRLSLEAVAECVETEAQLALLRELHCDYAQGYLIGRPMPLEELTELLTARRKSEVET